MRLDLGHQRRVDLPLTKHVKVYIEALSAFIHYIVRTDGLNTFLSQGCVLETATSAGIVAGRNFQGQGVGEEPPAAGASMRVNQ